MATYTGAKCLVCNEVFKDGDDIVVCPECGTPYHRDCYKQAGKCINDELHEKGGSWVKANEAEINANRCRRCGTRWGWTGLSQSGISGGWAGSFPEIWGSRTATGSLCGA